tara:strand:- start:1383 stop:1535 length:153 start_codon:yes stop_codon:yes gene_type:complete
MSTENERLVSTIKELIKESLKEDEILLDSPNKRRQRAVVEKRDKRGKRGK